MAEGTSMSEQMPDEARDDRLAQALEAALTDPRAPLPAGEPELAELVAIANDLRALPRPEFKARLGTALTRRIQMTATTATTATTRSGVREVIPYLAVRPALELIEFVVRAFGAQERSEEHTSELQSQFHLVCRLLLEKKQR